MQNDWRLNGQETCLCGATLIYQPWKPANPRNDHDHCEFCWEKFANYPGCLREGYSTTDRERWICEACFKDFAAQFEWEVAPRG